MDLHASWAPPPAANTTGNLRPACCITRNKAMVLGWHFLVVIMTSASPAGWIWQPRACAVFCSKGLLAEFLPARIWAKGFFTCLVPASRLVAHCTYGHTMRQGCTGSCLPCRPSRYLKHKSPGECSYAQLLQSGQLRTDCCGTPSHCGFGCWAHLSPQAAAVGSWVLSIASGAGCILSCAVWLCCPASLHHCRTVATTGSLL